MQYMMLIYLDPSASPRDPAAREKLQAEYDAFTREILDSKEMVAGQQLQGVDTATSIRVRDGKTTTTDGPFAETAEHLGGCYIVDVPDLDRALELAAKIPAARTGVIEVRPLVPSPA
jgi:hypothetical protein